MNLREMTIEQLMERRAQLAEMLETPDADLDAIEEEARGIREELERRQAEEARRNAIRESIATGRSAARVVENGREGEQRRSAEEIRNSQEYIDAFAEYVRGGCQDDRECRALLSESATDGTLPVPQFVDDIIRTAWDENSIMSGVFRADVDGEYEVGFEYESSDAVDLPEGTSNDIAEGTILIGNVKIVSEYIAKWTTISRKAANMRGERYLRFIYTSIMRKLAKKGADKLVSLIAAMPQTATKTAPSAAKITEAPGLATIAHAIAHLSDEAENPVIIMNKLTAATFEDVKAQANYSQDPLKGLETKFNNTLPPYDTATAGDVYAIVGDLEQGAVANFPNGDSVEFIFDEITRKKAGMIEVEGLQMLGLGVVSCGAFTLICKPSAN